MAEAATADAATYVMHLGEGELKRTLPLSQLPFRIGRSSEADLVLEQPYVSREHASLVACESQLEVCDRSSRHGTYVNGERVSRKLLQVGDVLQFGSTDAPRLELAFLETARKHETSTHGLLPLLHGMREGGSNLEKLRWFLQAARELNSAGAVDRIMHSLLETTLALARVERGFVFLGESAEHLRLACGMDASRNELEDVSTLSQSAMRQAIASLDDYLVTDTLSVEQESIAASIVMHSIRTVICIPLRQHRSGGGSKPGSSEDSPPPPPLLGVLYLDSRFAPARFSEVDHELMRNIAREAAALVENARLAGVEEEARQHEEELQIAARIQQGLMQVQIPMLSFAEIEAHSVACKSVGGDFFDVLLENDVLNVALVDVSGKGISAAILASTLQGMLYVQMQAGLPLHEIASATNAYLCHKNIGKYATMLLLRLHPDGRLEYLNCGHIQPRLCTGGQVSRLTLGNPPVGLLDKVTFDSAITVMAPGSHLILVSDGFTEAEDEEGNFFGEERLEAISPCGNIQAMLREMRDFCRTHPATDDCTVVRLGYVGTADAQISES